MADMRINNPFPFSPGAARSKDELEALLLKRRKLDHQNGTDFLTPKKSSDESLELFPEITRSLLLPEEGSDVDFDKPSFRAPRERAASKPTLPLPEPQHKPAKEVEKALSIKPKSSWISGYLPWNWNQNAPKIGEHRKEQGEKAQSKSTQTQPLVRYADRVKAKTTSQEDRDALDHLPNHGGAILAKLIGMITDYQTTSQVGQLEVFQANSDQLEEVRKEELKVALEKIAEHKALETWSYRSEMMQYLGAATGIISGTGMIASGLYTGGATVAPGVKALAGGTISLCATIAGKHYKERKISTAVSLAGSVLTGAGMYAGLKDLGKLAKHVELATSSVSTVMQTTIGYKSHETAANMYGINAKNVDLKFKREDGEQTMRKLVGGLKASKESTDLLGAATKALRTEDQIKSRIALGSKY